MDWPSLRSLSEPERRALLEAARPRRFDRGEVLVHEGTPADTMHLVVSGHLVVRTGTADGDSVLLNVLGPGDVLGELSLLPRREGVTRSASVFCLDAGVTRVLSAERFAAVCDAHPGVERWLTGVLADRVRDLSSRVRDLMLVNTEERVRSCLRDLADRFADLPGPQQVIPLTQEQIAEFVGATRPTVNLHLQGLADAGVIRLGRGRLTVLDPGRL